MTKISRTKRLRFDGIYIFASVFAAIGAFWLVGSYAFSKPAMTNTPGTYQLSKYAVSGTQNTYNLSFSANRTYCFKGNTLPNAVIVGPASGNPQTYTLTMSGNSACFNPYKSYSSVDLQILPSSNQNLQLIVN